MADCDCGNGSLDCGEDCGCGCICFVGQPDSCYMFCECKGQGPIIVVERRFGKPPRTRPKHRRYLILKGESRVALFTEGKVPRKASDVTNVRFRSRDVSLGGLALVFEHLLPGRILIPSGKHRTKIDVSKAGTLSTIISSLGLASEPQYNRKKRPSTDMPNLARKR